MGDDGPRLTAVILRPAPGLRYQVDRIRAGLPPAEAAALLRRVYGAWLVALGLKALGANWDVSWHFKWLRDDLAPPHLLNTAGTALMCGLVVLHSETRFGVDRAGLRLMQAGTAVFLLAIPADVLNHRINGLDITSWSVSHAGLYLGTALAIAGVIRGWAVRGTGQPRRTLILGALWLFFFENVWFPEQHQEYGVLALRAWDAGRPEAEPSLIAFAAEQLGRPVDRVAVANFALPVPAWVYPVWAATAAVLVLLVARRTVGFRWTATAVAGAYVAARCVTWPVLAAATFPRSAVPFLLVAAGLAVDLACLAGFAWPVEATLGAAAAVVAVYLGGYVQSYVLVAPPISYRFAPVAFLVLSAAWALTLAVLHRLRSTADW